MVGTRTKEVLYIRFNKTMRFSPAERGQKEKELALSTGCYGGITEKGRMPIVSDAGRVIEHQDVLEITPKWPGNVCIQDTIGFNIYQDNIEERFDEIERLVRVETAQRLARLKHTPVVMIYQPVVGREDAEIYYFEPQTLLFTLRRALSKVIV